MTFKENTYEFTNLVDLVLTNSRNTSDSHPLYIDADTEESINYGDFKRLVKQATFGFLDIGIKKGDSICVYSPNNVRKKKSGFKYIILIVFIDQCSFYFSIYISRR